MIAIVTMNLPETTQLNYSCSSVEPSHAFNSRECIIPKIPDTPQPKQQEMIHEIKPAVIKQEEIKPAVVKTINIVWNWF